MKRPPARRRLGQHFLEPAWAARVLDAIAPAADDSFLEIGPGRGALTDLLAARVARVVAVEIDRDLAAALEVRRTANLEVVNRDFLQMSTMAFHAALATAGVRGQVRVAGNLPYNVASPILFRLRDLAAEGLPIVDATVMLQHEVANRLTALPGQRDYGVLTVLIGYRTAAERLLELPPGAFRPAPKVRSTLVRLRFHDPVPKPLDEAAFERLVKAVFSQRRKTLVNALKGAPGVDFTADQLLAAAGLDGRRRPGTLTIPELVGLSDAWSRATGSTLPPARPAML